MTTVGLRIEQTGGRTSGFDYMRLVLSCGVIAMHSVIICYGQMAEIAFWQSPARPVIRLILPMFFALSGFLVAGSLERSKSIGGFLGLRAIRILPALSVEVLLSAIIIGAIFTTLPLAEYYTHPMFFSYFLNAIGDIHFRLPGVFLENPLPNVVNNQLWTIPFELYCYATLAFLGLIGIRRWRMLGPVAIAVLTFAYLAYRLRTYGAGASTTGGPMAGVSLVVCFLAGVSVYQFRDKLWYAPVLFWPAFIVSAALVSVVPYGDFFAPPLIAYITVYIGLLDPRRLSVIRGADYSYGIFLYGSVIQQMVAALGPWTHHWALNVAMTLPIAAAFAALSWHYVEKPALRLRGPLTRAEGWWLLRAKPAAQV